MACLYRFQIFSAYVLHIFICSISNSTDSFAPVERECSCTTSFPVALLEVEMGLCDAYEVDVSRDAVPPTPAERFRQYSRFF